MVELQAPKSNSITNARRSLRKCSNSLRSSVNCLKHQLNCLPRKLLITWYPYCRVPNLSYLRPYRYNYAHKDKIESQIRQILENGWIQESDNPYASPTLLVKKKTKDWCLCVDYKRLNAMIVENKFPLPIIDELLDELVGAQWFTTLDLSLDFH